MKFLTGVSTVESRAARRPSLGLLVSPDNSVHRQHESYAHSTIAADNGQYVASKKGIAFDAERAAYWRGWLAAMPCELEFAALPDVLDWLELDPVDAPGKLTPVGNLEATLELSSVHLDAVLELGITPALVAQDGLESVREFPRWRELGALFVGGSDAYKLGPVAAEVVAEANELGLWTHIGRVNSWRRIAHCLEVGADSVDGTFLKFGRKGENWPRLAAWLDRIESAPAPSSFALAA